MGTEIYEEKVNIAGIVEEIKTLIPELDNAQNKEAIEKLANEIKNQNRDNVWGQGNKYIVIKLGFKYHKIFLRDIVFVETQNRKVILHTKNDEFDFYGKLKDLEKVLGNGFYRVHRAYIVNMEHVYSFDTETIQTTKGEIIMSKAKYPDFVKQIKHTAEISV